MFNYNYYLKKKNQKGQSTVELALILPILLVLLLGIIDFGMMLHYYLMVTNAAREGVRASILGKTDEDVEIIINNAAPGLGLSITDGEIAIDKSDFNKRKITVIYNYKSIVGLQYILRYFGSTTINGSFPLKGTAVMQTE